MSNAKIPSVQQLIFEIYTICNTKKTIANSATKLQEHIMKKFGFTQEVIYRDFFDKLGGSTCDNELIYRTAQWFKAFLEQVKLTDKKTYNKSLTVDDFTLDFFRKQPFYTFFLIYQVESYLSSYSYYQDPNFDNFKECIDYELGHMNNLFDNTNFFNDKKLNPFFAGIKEDLLKIINFNVLATTQNINTTQQPIEKEVIIEKQVFIDIDLMQPELDIRDELLQQLKQLDPTQFEKFALRLISSIIQENEEETKNLVIHNGQVGDGGIDGRFQMKNKFGHYDNYVIQCKRYDTTSIGRPELQQFVGAMALYQTTQGVFITTSTFAKTAFDFINSVQHSYSIKTMDGQQLVDYMLEHKIGVKEEITQVMDREFFNQFKN